MSKNVLITDYEEYTNATTDKAYALWDGKSVLDDFTRCRPRLIFVPKSQVDKTEDGFFMPEWLALKSGLI